MSLQLTLFIIDRFKRSQGRKAGPRICHCSFSGIRDRNGLSIDRRAIWYILHAGLMKYIMKERTRLHGEYMSQRSQYLDRGEGKQEVQREAEGARLSRCPVL
jgi:hypothetical protein